MRDHILRHLTEVPASRIREFRQDIAKNVFIQAVNAKLPTSVDTLIDDVSLVEVGYIAQSGHQREFLGD